MSLEFQILGNIGGDNALFVKADSGQSIDRWLFDCGESARRLTMTETQELDGLFFSHLHMDHIGGFDPFFRRNYDRTTRPNLIWGPARTSAILQHRFRGYLWNLHHDMEATWRVMDVKEDHIDTTRFELSEAFALAHPEGTRSRNGVLHQGAASRIEALDLDHGTRSLGYIVREPDRSNVDLTQMTALGLRPGPWVKQLKECPDEDATLEIAGTSYSLKELRKALVHITTGDVLAYLTDFHVHEADLEKLAVKLSGCQTLVCEAQYRPADYELAEKHRHMTASLTGRLAHAAGVSDLVVIHVSSRYSRQEWGALLEEVRREFPGARYPDHWSRGGLG